MHCKFNSFPVSILKCHKTRWHNPQFKCDIVKTTIWLKNRHMQVHLSHQSSFFVDSLSIIKTSEKWSTFKRRFQSQLRNKLFSSWLSWIKVFLTEIFASDFAEGVFCSCLKWNKWKGKSSQSFLWGYWKSFWKAFESSRISKKNSKIIKNFPKKLFHLTTHSNLRIFSDWIL